jgi:hypothetical protein
VRGRVCAVGCAVVRNGAQQCAAVCSGCHVLRCALRYGAVHGCARMSAGRSVLPCAAVLGRAGVQGGAQLGVLRCAEDCYVCPSFSQRRSLLAAQARGNSELGSAMDPCVLTLCSVVCTQDTIQVYDTAVTSLSPVTVLPCGLPPSFVPPCQALPRTSPGSAEPVRA